MKGDITIKVLEGLREAGMDTTDFLKMFLTVGYGASYGKMQYTLSKMKSARGYDPAVTTEQRIRQKYYDLLYRLKKDGLIKRELKKHNKIFTITKKGLARLALLKELVRKKMPSTFYPKREGSTFVIVAFDIPEKERRKRDWLRGVLKSLQLKMVQKSLWLGKVKIPKEFLDDLRKLNLLDYVEIFEITKTGSLKNLG